MEFLTEKDLLSEGLFSASLQEISYNSALDQLRKMTKQLKDKISKTAGCKSIKVYNDEKIYPNVFVISSKDYRMTLQSFLSEPFSIFDLERESELTENVIIKELNSIFDELNYAYKDMGLTFIQNRNDPNSIRFYAYMDFKKCLKNIVDYKKPKIEVNAKDMISEFKEYKEEIITTIKKHDLGKTLKFDRNYNSEVHRYQATSGSGLCYCLQDQSYGFIDRDFEWTSPTIPSFSVIMNLAYFLEEGILRDSNITIARFPNKNGSYGLWLVSKPNVKVTY